MPRLDNSSELVQGMFGSIKWNNVDVGRNPPIDLCMECYEYDYEGLPCCEHPSYDDDPYRCYDCYDILSEDRDG